MLLRQSPHLVRNATHNLHTPRTYDSISLGQLAAGPLYMARDGATKFGTPTREVGDGVLLVKQLRIKMGKAQGWMRRG